MRGLIVSILDAIPIAENHPQRARRAYAWLL
jgi:hypothetical protein